MGVKGGGGTVVRGGGGTVVRRGVKQGAQEREKTSLLKEIDPARCVEQLILVEMGREMGSCIYKRPSLELCCKRRKAAWMRAWVRGYKRPVSASQFWESFCCLRTVSHPTFKLPHMCHTHEKRPGPGLASNPALPTAAKKNAWEGLGSRLD